MKKDIKNEASPGGVWLLNVHFGVRAHRATTGSGYVGARVACCTARTPGRCIAGLLCRASSNGSVWSAFPRPELPSLNRLAESVSASVVLTSSDLLVGLDAGRDSRRCVVDELRLAELRRAAVGVDGGPSRRCEGTRRPLIALLPSRRRRHAFLKRSIFSPSQRDKQHQCFVAPAVTPQ
jgi:hypothetical protein